MYGAKLTFKRKPVERLTDLIDDLDERAGDFSEAQIFIERAEIIAGEMNILRDTRERDELCALLSVARVLLEAAVANVYKSREDLIALLTARGEYQHPSIPPEAYRCHVMNKLGRVSSEG